MLTEASLPDLELARHLLSLEGATDAAADCAAAGGRVYDKLDAHLAQLLGSAGVRALLVRSAQLARRRFSFLEAEAVESSTKLRECLQGRSAAIARESAAALFGTLFALLRTFIGERLTTQALRRAWPKIEDTTLDTTKETKK